MPKVRTTFEPTVELEVSEREAAELELQGLLVKTKATTDEGIRKAALAQTAPENAPAKAEKESN